MHDEQQVEKLQQDCFFNSEMLLLFNTITNPKPISMKKLFAVLVFMVMTLTALLPQTVDEILGKYFESIGGIEKWKEIKTMKLTGQIPTPQGEFTFEMSRKAPNKMIISLDVMGQKLVPQAYDGEVAWTLNPFTGNTAPQKLPEAQARDIIRDAAFEDPFIDFASKGHEVSFEGTGDVDSVKCYILKLVQNKGKEKRNQPQVITWTVKAIYPYW